MAWFGPSASARESPRVEHDAGALCRLDGVEGQLVFRTELRGELSVEGAQLETPQLTLSADPVLGTTPMRVATSSAAQPETSLMLFGFNPAAIPGFFGGTWLVIPPAAVGLPILLSGWAVPLKPPNNAALCGFSVYMQMLQTDGGSPAGVASARGLKATLGL